MCPDIKDIYRRMIILKKLIEYARHLPVYTMPAIYKIWRPPEKIHYDQSVKKHSIAAVSILKSLNLWEYLSPLEKQFLKTPASQISDGSCNAIIWRLEDVAIFASALNILPGWPALDKRQDVSILELISDSGMDEAGNPAPIRPMAEIKLQQEIYTYLHWRAKTRYLNDTGAEFPKNDTVMEEKNITDFDGLVRYSVELGYKKGFISQIIDEDLAYAGKAFRALCQEEFITAWIIIKERHTALNWLCFGAPEGNWDLVRCDTTLQSVLSGRFGG